MPEGRIERVIHFLQEGKVDELVEPVLGPVPVASEDILLLSFPDIGLEGRKGGRILFRSQLLWQLVEFKNVHGRRFLYFMFAFFRDPTQVQHVLFVEGMLGEVFHELSAADNEGSKDKVPVLVSSLSLYHESTGLELSGHFHN